jgi:hypothetical protein
MGHIFLSFTGALVFVSRYEVESHPERNEMRVLLAETRPSPSESHSSHKEDEIHLPRLVCATQSVVTGSGARSPDETHGERAIFYLDDQDLFLLEKRESLGITSGEISICPTQDTVCSFSWVAPLSAVDPGSEFIKPECFEKLNPDPSVIARVALTDGSYPYSPDSKRARTG